MSRLVGNLLRGFGAAPPTAPSLSIADNLNGSGALATVSAGDPGSTNTLYTEPYGGTFTAGNSRTGNGTIAFSTTITGRYWGYVIASNASGQSISSVVSFTVSSPTTPSFTNAERADSTLDTILTLFVDRLIDQVPGFNAENCFLTFHPDITPPPVTADVFCTVSPMSGAFDLTMQDGGGKFQATIESGAMVRLHSIVQLDQANHATILLTDQTRGIISTLTSILSALTCDDLDDGIKEVLREPVKPTELTWGLNEDRSLATCDITFRLYYDWLLS